MSAAPFIILLPIIHPIHFMEFRGNLDCKMRNTGKVFSVAKCTLAAGHKFCVTFFSEDISYFNCYFWPYSQGRWNLKFKKGEQGRT